MYKIYINNNPLLLTKATTASNRLRGDAENLVGRYSGQPKSLLAYVDMLEKAKKNESVVLYSENYEKLAADFQSLYKIIEAAGGLVFNDKGQILLIFRRGFWDLPKGKVDKGESKTETALREVREETGLQELNLGERLCETWHTYRSPKNKRILKRTTWFIMQSDETNLSPQVEEDIEKAVWTKPEGFLKSGAKVYNSILDVLKTGLPKETMKK